MAAVWPDPENVAAGAGIIFRLKKNIAGRKQRSACRRRRRRLVTPCGGVMVSGTIGMR
jgi:hypothetical protein